MPRELKVISKILDQNNEPIRGCRVKIFDENGEFLTSGFTDRSGLLNVSCSTGPQKIKLMVGNETYEKPVTASMLEVNFESIPILIPLRVAIQKIGPVTTNKINNKGFAEYPWNPLALEADWKIVTDRPFRGRTSIYGHIADNLGTLDCWKLFAAKNTVLHNDPRLLNLNKSDPDPFTLLAQGDSKVLSPIYTWSTFHIINDLWTIILIAWDKSGNRYIDTQPVMLYNKSFNPKAIEIINPRGGSIINRPSNEKIVIEGTASPEHWMCYKIDWLGGSNIEFNWTRMEYGMTTNPAEPCFTSVIGGKLAEFYIGGLSGEEFPNNSYHPFCVRIGVADRTIFNDNTQSYMEIKHYTFVVKPIRS